jgi:predicted 3-demethylubiquinone-9 3-methyltransferase (glyoxalase superfamily)
MLPYVEILTLARKNRKSFPSAQSRPQFLILARSGFHQESACGWCKDRWGVSWQITPRVLTEALAAGGDEAKRAFGAMMGMKKIDIAAIKAARRG